MNKVYLLIDMEAFPPGWTNVQRHNGHAACVFHIGSQSTTWPHLKTHSRPNTPTLFNSEGIVIENGATCEQFIFAGQVSITMEDDIIYEIAKGIWCDENEEPSPGQISAVGNKIKIIEVSRDELLAMITDNLEYWGEIGT